MAWVGAAQGWPVGAVVRLHPRTSSLLAAIAACWPAHAHGEQLLTLPAALREARAANARLPMAQADVQTGKARVREVHAELWPTLSGEGDLRYAAPASAYPDNGSEERLELFVRGPIYDGGALRARVAAAKANATGFAARYRVAAADVDLEVRVRFSAVLEAESEVAVQHEAVTQLARYLDELRLRQLAGEGLEVDRLRTEAQLATERVAAAAAQLRLGEARYALNDTLGREPSASLALADLPTPTAPPAQPSTRQPWRMVPDLAGAAADIAAAEHAIDVVRAERKPHLFFEVGGGYLGVADARYRGDPFGQRVLRGFGFSLMLSYDWTLLDFGVYGARLQQAHIRRERARDQRVVLSREVRLAWEGARLQLLGLFQQVQLYAEAVPKARDAFLAAQSLYRGGAGTALGVLDAHRRWVEAALAAARALRAYRVAEARHLRWSGP